MPNTQKSSRRQSVSQLKFLLTAKTKKEFWLPYTNPLLTLDEQVFLCILLISFESLKWSVDVCTMQRWHKLSKLFRFMDTCWCITLYFRHLLACGVVTYFSCAF